MNLQIFKNIRFLSKRFVTQEETLSSESESLIRILNSISDYVWSADVVDRNVIYRYYSNVVQTITGYPPAFFMSGVEAWLSIIHPNDQLRIKRDIKKEISGEQVEHEYRIIRSDGKIKWLLGTTSPSFDKDGQVVRLDGIVRDITKIKESEDELLSYSRRTTALLNVQKAITSTMDLNQIIKIFLAEIKGVISFDTISIHILKKGYLEIIGCHGFEQTEQLIGLKIPIEQNFPNYKVITSQQIYSIDRIAEEYPHFFTSSHRYQSGNIISWLGVPLVSKGLAKGMIAIDRNVFEPFSQIDKEIAFTIANQLSLAIDNAYLLKKVHGNLNRLESLREIDQSILSDCDLQTTLNIILSYVREQLNVDAGTVLINNSDANVLEYGAGLGFRTDALRYTSLRFGEGFSGKVVAERRIIEVSDSEKLRNGFEMSPTFQDEQFSEYIGIPLITKGNVVGVLEIFNRIPIKPEEEWLNFLNTLAGQAAIAIDSQNLVKNLRNMNSELILAYDATIEGWAQALELRDMESEGHSRRVVEMTILLARKIGIPESELENYRRGALLHDIGKMGVPDSILQKAGKLSDKEWEIMKMHPVYAYKWLSKINFLRPALDIPYCHHEKWDGTGYPQGLKGNDIPISARIFSVIDVWDALNSDRPYRKAWSQSDALIYLKEQSGVHFDPTVVSVFINFLENEFLIN